MALTRRSMLTSGLTLLAACAAPQTGQVAKPQPSTGPPRWPTRGSISAENAVDVTELGRLHFSPGSAKGVSWNGDQLCVADVGRVHRWLPGNGWRHDVLSTESGEQCWQVAVGGDGMAAAVNSGGRLYVWRREQEVWQQKFSDWLLSVCWGPGNRILCGDTRGRAMVIALDADGSRVARLKGLAADLISTAWARDGTLATGDYVGVVRIYAGIGATPTQLNMSPDSAGDVNGLAFSESPRLLIAARQDGSTTALDYRAGRQRWRTRGGQGWARAVAASAREPVVASAGYDGAVRLLSATDGKALTILRGHAGSVWGAAFSPDGSLLASGDDTGSLILWGAPRG